MPTIELITLINAPAERCFQLSLSVDLHMLSTENTNEKAISGVTHGIMKLNDTVTWRAKHFGVYQKLTTIISEYSYPYKFTDEMVKGAFKKIHHEHLFKQEGEATIMTDIFTFEAPLGILGVLFSKLILTEYMRRFLTKRNETIKRVAEGTEWSKLIG